MSEQVFGTPDWGRINCTAVDEVDQLREQLAAATQRAEAAERERDELAVKLVVLENNLRQLPWAELAGALVWSTNASEAAVAAFRAVATQAGGVERCPNCESVAVLPDADSDGRNRYWECQSCGAMWPRQEAQP